MGRDDQLRPRLRQLMDASEQRHLPDRRQGGLRLIEDIQSAAGKAFPHQCQEALAV